MSASDFDSSGTKEEVERLVARLAELRAVLGRIERRCLEADDWAAVSALLSELIDQVESGQQWPLELSDEDEEASSGTNEAAGAEESKE